MSKLVILFALFFGTGIFAQEKKETETLKPGAKAIDFELKGADGK